MNVIRLFLERPVVAAVLRIFWLSTVVTGMLLVILPTVFMIGLILEAIAVIPAGTVPRLPQGTDPLIIP